MYHLFAQTVVPSLPIEKGLTYVLGFLLVLALGTVAFLYFEGRKSDRALGEYAKDVGKVMIELNKVLVSLAETNRSTNEKVAERLDELSKDLQGRGGRR